MGNMQDEPKTVSDSESQEAIKDHWDHVRGYWGPANSGDGNRLNTSKTKYIMII